MINIKISKFNNQIVGVECCGHSGYSERGSDIVCSAVSSIIQSCALGLTDVVKLNINIQCNEKNGYYKFNIPKQISSEQQNDAQVLLNTMYLSLQDLQSGYSKYMKLEEISR